MDPSISAAVRLRSGQALAGNGPNRSGQSITCCGHSKEAPRYATLNRLLWQLTEKPNARPTRKTIIRTDAKTDAIAQGKRKNRPATENRPQNRADPRRRSMIERIFKREKICIRARRDPPCCSPVFCRCAARLVAKTASPMTETVFPTGVDENFKGDCFTFRRIKLRLC